MIYDQDFEAEVSGMLDTAAVAEATPGEEPSSQGQKRSDSAATPGSQPERKRRLTRKTSHCPQSQPGTPAVVNTAGDDPDAMSQSGVPGESYGAMGSSARPDGPMQAADEAPASMQDDLGARIAMEEDMAGEQLLGYGLGGLLGHGLGGAFDEPPSQAESRDVGGSPPLVPAANAPSRDVSLDGREESSEIHHVASRSSVLQRRADLVDALQPNVETDEESIIEQTSRLRALVKDRRGDQWPLAIQHLAVAGLTVFRYRLIDITIREHVHLLYVIEGERWIRAHRGSCYIYRCGAWVPFTGVVPQGSLARLKEFFLCLEGLFRSLPEQTQRTEDALLVGMDNAIRSAGGLTSCLETWTEVSISSIPTTRWKQQRWGAPGAAEEGGEDDVTSGMPWSQAVAYALSRCASTLQRELLSKNLIPYFVEWCETPQKAMPGLALDDSCFVFDTDKGHMVPLPTGPDNNIYIILPHSLLTPANEAAEARVSRFFEQTFWSNKKAFDCQLAACGLALRGRHVDRAFWSKGPGGVGQSLNSHFLAALFGHNHAFLDMNIYYSDDELRTEGFCLSHVVNNLLMSGFELR